MHVPEGWRKVSLSSVAEVRTGVAKGKQNLKDAIELPYLRVANVQDGYIDLSEVKHIQIERNQIERFSLKIGDVLMTEGGDFDKLGRGDVWNGQINPCLHQNHVFAVRPNQLKLDSYFLAALSASHYGKTYFLSCSKQSTNLASINSTQLKDFPVLLPPFPEQQKLAQILSTWDKAIEKLEALIAAKQKRKKALMQQLLTGNNRFAGFKEKKWKTILLSDFLIPTFREENKPIENYLAIGVRSHCKGTFQKPDSEPDKIEMDKLYKVKKDDLIVNITFAWEGAIAIVKEEDEGGYVSHRFPTYTFNPEITIPDFFRYVIQTNRFRYILDLISPGGAGRNRVLSKKEFLKIEWRLPCVDEQREIALVLTAADTEIETHQKQLAALKAQKKGLMQQLLTGKKRVKVDSHV